MRTFTALLLAAPFTLMLFTSSNLSPTARPLRSGNRMIHGGEKMIDELSNSYTMGCPPVRGDNPRALASGICYVQVHKHGITI